MPTQQVAAEIVLQVAPHRVDVVPAACGCSYSGQVLPQRIPQPRGEEAQRLPAGPAAILSSRDRAPRTDSKASDPMTPGRIATYVLVLIGVVLVVRWGLSPQRTRLPDGPDLASVEADLQRMSAEEQALVRAYVVRSKGQYIPRTFSEDEAVPLDARTFGDAITLQRRLLARQEAYRAEQRVRDAQRDATLAPLRAVLQLELVRRELADFGGLYGHPLPPSTPPRPHEDLHALTLWRVRNVSSRAVASFAGSANVYGTEPRVEFANLPVGGCYIEHDTPLSPGASVDVACGKGTNTLAQDRAYIALPASALRIDWMPRRIAYAGGGELKYDGN